MSKTLKLTKKQFETLLYVLDMTDPRDANEHFGGWGRDGEGAMRVCDLKDKVRSYNKVAVRSLKQKEV
jgi:hypothetical protein